VAKKNIERLRGRMTWLIYNAIMKKYSGKDFHSLRIRLAVFLLAVTSARISQILVLKVRCLKILQENFLIEIGNQTLFIQNQKIRDIITERKEDITYLYTIKTENDFIFTSESNLNAKGSLRRESFTRSVNKALQLVGQSLEPTHNLSSQSFRQWDKKF
jgi:serine phosphatase RsbU (regulator of sigma subunit)